MHSDTPPLVMYSTCVPLNVRTVSSKRGRLVQIQSSRLILQTFNSNKLSFLPSLSPEANIQCHIDNILWVNDLKV
jgi:hypothetical protein